MWSDMLDIFGHAQDNSVSVVFMMLWLWLSLLFLLFLLLLLLLLNGCLGQSRWTLLSASAGQLEPSRLAHLWCCKAAGAPAAIKHRDADYFQRASVCVMEVQELAHCCCRTKTAREQQGEGSILPETRSRARGREREQTESMKIRCVTS